MSTPPDALIRKPAGRPVADPGATPATSAAATGTAATGSAPTAAVTHGDKLTTAAQLAAGAGATPASPQGGPAAGSGPAPAALAPFNHQLIQEVNAVLERHGVFLGDDDTAPDFSGLLRAHTVQLAHTLVLMQQRGIEPARIDKTIQQVAAKLPKGVKMVAAALAVIEAERLAAEAQAEFLKSA